MSWRRILILSWFDLKHSVLKTKGLLFLIPFAFFMAYTFYLLEDGGIELMLSQQGLALSSFLLDPSVSELLLVENPAILSICLYITLTIIPPFMMLAANNQLASDAGHGAMRYLLTRCSRTELFISRFLACVFLVLIAFVIMLGYGMHLSLEIDQFSMVETSAYAFKVGALLLIYALPIIAFMSIFSAFFSSTIGSLLWGAVCFFILAAIRGWYIEDFPKLKYLLPNIYKQDLLIVNSPDLPITLLYLLVYTLVYGLLGWLIFKQRNL